MITSAADDEVWLSRIFNKSDSGMHVGRKSSRIRSCPARYSLMVTTAARKTVAVFSFIAIFSQCRGFAGPGISCDINYIKVARDGVFYLVSPKLNAFSKSRL